MDIMGYPKIGFIIKYLFNYGVTWIF